LLLRFDAYAIDTKTRELRRGSELVPVEPQVFDLLVFLIEQRDRVVSKDDLVANVWHGRIVSDSTLTSRINAARKALGDSGEQQNLIRTIARKGFRFIGTLREHDTQPKRMPRPAGAASERPAIAVLPFSNMSGDPEQEYFSDGISEDIITALSKLRWFLVIARNSSFIYKGRTVHLKQVGEELGVDYVLEGSVRKAGHTVRITVQLERADNGYHLWSETYDRDLKDVFKVQDDIARAVVDKLKLTLLDRVPAAPARTSNPEAHSLYLQGRYFAQSDTRAGLDKAVDYFKRAIAIDPGYASA